MNVTGLTKSQLFLSKEISEKQNFEIKKKLARLETWEPIEYIINKAEFYGLDFYVDSRVLVPRNNTEIMVEQVISVIPAKAGISKKGNTFNRFLPSQEWQWITLIDVWTWSSCIPIAILKNTNFIEQCFVVDISEKALKISKINIKKYNLKEKITQINSDLLTVFIEENSYKLEKNIVITANLPYVKQDDFENMSDETIKFEPSLALYGWAETGFELYERLIKQCLELKEKWHTITLFIEIGFDQYDYSKEYLEDLWLNFEYFKDNGGIWRCIKIEF